MQGVCRRATTDGRVCDAIEPVVAANCVTDSRDCCNLPWCIAAVLP